VSNLADLDRLFSKVRLDHGRIDILFATAGLGALEPLGKITEAAFDLIFGVNVKGTVFIVQKGLSADAGWRVHHPHGIDGGLDGNAGFSIYSASKAAIRNLARSWALDLRGAGPDLDAGHRGPQGASRLDRPKRRGPIPDPRNNPRADRQACGGCRRALPRFGRQQFHDGE
jgi:NAD(P)-dependent dehydrogenase (short-subunit alcohol dehydrogenase family)